MNDVGFTILILLSVTYLLSRLVGYSARSSADSAKERREEERRRALARLYGRDQE